MDHVVSPDPTEFLPGHVRSLRGALSRAVFARALGVTPQTIYRWELPDGAAEARRPGREQLLRLQRFRSGAGVPRS
jgi:DNA-binding transcriptional regulator YiaG